MATNTTSAPFGIPAPPPPSVPDISQYISVAQQQLSPGFSDVLTAVNNQGQQALKSSQDTVSGLKDTETTVQKTYADLAKEFETEQGLETTTDKNVGEARIGEAKVALAKSGVTDAQGSFRAPVTGAEQDLQSNIAQIADKYGAKQQDVADALAGNIASINNQIIQATNSGNEAYASALTQVAQMKYNQQQQVVSLAQQMQSAQTKYEQDAWKDYMDEVSSYHQQQTLDIMAARLEQTATNESRQYNLDVAKLNQSTKDKYKVSYSKDTSGNVTGAAYKDPSGQNITIAEYLTAKNGNPPTITQIANTLAASGAEGDVKLANDILGTGSSARPPLPLSDLVQRYPYIFGNSYVNQ